MPSKPRLSRTSQKAAADAAAQSQDVKVQLSKHPEESVSDHQYALDPVTVKKKLIEAQERVEKLQRILRNARDRERRHKKIVKSLLRKLKDKNMLTKELKQELDFGSDPLD